VQRYRPQGNDTLIRYWHKDHLGSIAAITTDTALIVERFTYDVWGRRIQQFIATGEPLEERGYTGHETLDDVAVAGIGLVHMNGRIYDPVTGSFLQADPVVQDPWNGQNYNRYSYVLNNPLSFTDPSGYSWWTKFRDKWAKPIAIAVAAWWTAGAIAGAMISEASGSAFAAELVAGGNAVEAAGAAEAAAAAAAPGAYAVGGAAAGFAAGGIQGGNVESAVYGAFAGGFGNYLAGGTYFSNPIEQIGNAGTALIESRYQDVGRMAMRYVLAREMSTIEAKIAQRLGVRSEALDVGLMSLSVLGNAVLTGGEEGYEGSRFRTNDKDFDKTYGVGFRGYGNRGTAGYFFDSIDAVLAFQGKPTASLRDFAYSGYRGVAVTRHSLGTLDASNAVSRSLAVRAELYSVPFGNSAAAAANITLGDFDPVNGGYMGRIFNWGARTCALGFRHSLSDYYAAGCR
jgi:RHS repeat-associated protein